MFPGSDGRIPAWPCHAGAAPASLWRGKQPEELRCCSIAGSRLLPVQPRVVTTERDCDASVTLFVNTVMNGNGTYCTTGDLSAARKNGLYLQLSDCLPKALRLSEPLEIQGF